MSLDPHLSRLIAVLENVPGVIAIVLGGSRARGTAHAASDYDIGLYFSAASPLDIARLREAVCELADDPGSLDVTEIGGWGPWIVGGAWLAIDGRKVDLLYRDTDAVARVITDCRNGRIEMHYQPGHPHGFCSAIWMGEVALGQPLHDPTAAIGRLKAATSPYPPALRASLIRRFQWEILFSIENAELAVSRGHQTHIAGCVYRALVCAGQVLFALNARYLINEKGALEEAAAFPITVPNMTERVSGIWRKLGNRDFTTAFAVLRLMERELSTLVNDAAPPP
jgi:Polymerase beta, Nucleotidyltransferase